MDTQFIMNSSTRTDKESKEWKEFGAMYKWKARDQF